MLIGKPIPLPAPVGALEAFEEMEISLADDEPSGIKIVLHAGREGPLGLLGPPFIDDLRFQPDSRVIISMIFDIKPVVIFDGIITETRYLPGQESGEGKLVLLGNDLTWLMDLEEVHTEHPAMDETATAYTILANYIQYGVTPDVYPPTVIDPPIPVDRTPVQNCTDWAYLKQLARRAGYDCFLDPGPLPGMSRFYWGPRPGFGMRQKVLSANVGSMSDVSNLSIQHSGRDLTTVSSSVQDRNTGKTMPVEAPLSTRTPMGAAPDSLTRTGSTRIRHSATSGLNMTQAYGQAQGMVNSSSDNVMTVHGTVNSIKYNDALKAFSPVFLRGVGIQHGGDYQVSKVVHKITPGNYTQDFVLKRAERYTMSPVTPVDAMV